MQHLAVFACFMVSTVFAVPILPQGNLEYSSFSEQNAILTPFSSLGDTVEKSIDEKARAKSFSAVPPFPDSGRKYAILELKSKESLPIQLDEKYGKIRDLTVRFTDPQPIVDTIQEHEKYGKDGGKMRQIGIAVIGGYEAFSNIINAVVELPFTALKYFGRKATASLNTVGEKLVGLN